MSVFSEISFTWNNEKIVIPAKKVFGLIAEIENYITLSELTDPRRVRFSALAQAWAAALNYAGYSNTSAEEVYKTLFSGEDAKENIRTAITTLQLMMVPPSEIIEKTGIKKKTETTKKKSKS